MNKELKTIWIVEDDPGCQFVYHEVLSSSFKIQVFNNLKTFRLALAKNLLPNLLIADIRLPDESFLDFFYSEEARLLSNIPCLMVSAVDDVDVLRFCLSRENTDYMTKPFGKAELTVKVERMLSGERPKKGPFKIDHTAFTVSVGKLCSETLTSKEFQILCVLQSSQNYRATRAEILSAVWQKLRVQSKTLDVHLHHLRQKLGPLGIEIQFIHPNCFALLCNGVDS